MKRFLNILFSGLLGVAAQAEWRSHQGDARRSGVATTDVNAPLKPVWRRASPVAPATAWTGPAKWDAYSGNKGLQSLRNFDPAFYVTIADGTVYFGSSVDHAVHALDARTGKERWVHFADGPVRLPPTLDGGRVYFGSDDGAAYCVDAKTGDRVWRFAPKPEAREIVNNGSFISPFPIRTGVVVHEGNAYFAGSLLPWRESLLCSVDAASGKPEGAGRYVKVHQAMTLQGAPLLAGDALLIPQGRSPMRKFKLQDGSSMGQVADAGGVHCLLTEDNRILSGPKTQKYKDNVLQLSEAATGKRLLTLNGVYRAAVADGILYFQQGQHLEALDYAAYIGVQSERAKLKAAKKATKEALAALTEREQAARKWRVSHPVSANLIVTPTRIITGSHDVVHVFNRETGVAEASLPVEGTAYGLAVGEGLLIVSTDHGHITAFGKPE